MLQALQGVIKVSGQRMSEKHREEILSTLITLQSTAHEGHRLEIYTLHALIHTPVALLVYLIFSSIQFFVTNNFSRMYLDFFCVADFLADCVFSDN